MDKVRHKTPGSHKKQKNVLDYFLSLPTEYFSFHICGFEDTPEARAKNIMKKSIEAGYIKFEEECVGSFNELVLFKDSIEDADILAITKYKGRMFQTLYLIELINGEWVDVKDKRFPDLNSIRQRIDQNIPSFDKKTQAEIKRVKEEANGLLSVEFLLPEENKTIAVLMNPELTNNETQLAFIKWENNKFEIQ